MELLPLRQESLSQYQEKLRWRRKVQTLAKLAVAAGVAVLLVLVASASFSQSKLPYVAELETVVRKFKDQNFSAVVGVSADGHPKFADAIGLASEELNVPLEESNVFPIGSNSKLFVSVALYQLQERGLVNLSLPVNEYLTQQDFANFGFANQTRWCPRLLNALPSSPCENITFVNFLNMGSGIGDELNCDNIEPQYCRQSASDLAVYKGSIGAHVGSFINDPLVFKPGSNYSYSNPNFVLLSYMTEKISGQALEVYVKEQIFDKIGLTDTFYDPYSGLLGVNRGYVEQYVDYYVAGTAEDGEDKPAEYITTGTCSPYMNSGAISGSGGFRSTTKDMHQWYSDLFHNHGHSSKVLSEQSISDIVHRRNPVNPSYAQGVGVAFASESESDWPELISYCGGMKCALTCMSMQVFAPEKSVIASSFTNHVQFYFVSLAAFQNTHPTEFLPQPSQAVATEGMGVLELLSDLMTGFLKYY